MKFLFTFLLLVLSRQGMAVDCSDENITLSTQSDMNNFQATYGNCDRISGDLSIDSTEISNLSGLANIESITGSFYIWYNNNLVNLDGLSNLKTIGTDLQIYNNDALTSITELSNLSTVDGDLKIWINNSLTDCSAISELVNTGVAGEITVYQNGSGCSSAEEIINSSSTPTPTPPYSGTVYIDPDWIIESDPTTYLNSAYDGIQNVLMYDRRTSAWERVDAHIWILSYSDSISINAQVNAEFDKESSKKIAEKWGGAVGKLPKTLRRDVDELWIHDGDEVMGGGNRSILIHVGQGDVNYSRGWAEETLLHEAVHTSLDSYYKDSADWLAAQESDGNYISDYARDYPTREDLAESFGPYMAIRILTNRVKASDKEKILSAMPARIAFLDSLSLDWSPWSELPSSVEDKIIFPATTCKASTPASSIQLQSRESGLTNTKNDANISIACPINYGTSANQTLSFTLKASNSDSSSHVLSCKLHEYIGEALSSSLSSQTALSADGTGIINWNNWRPTNNLTSYTITCELPPHTAIISIETRAAY
ncbi:MAG: hypothetical protein P8J18_09000 [Halieaceae bacterium]|nr:hypothetical protein [Halieaceae bacterium]